MASTTNNDNDVYSTLGEVRISVSLYIVIVSFTMLIMMVINNVIDIAVLSVVCNNYTCSGVFVTV